MGGSFLKKVREEHSCFWRSSNNSNRKFLSDPFGQVETKVKATASGVVIGRFNLPLINEGEALFHIARFDRSRKVAQTVKAYRSALTPDEDYDAMDDDPPVV